MSDMIDYAFEFEPGAATPIFVRAVDKSGQANTSSVAAFLSVSLADACIPINGVWDETRSGYSFDLNLLEEYVSPGSYMAYLYMRWGEKPVRVASMKLKAVRGCVWQSN